MKRKKHTRKVETPEVEVTMSTGTVVRCLPIASTLQAIRNTVNLPSVPTYTMKDVAGSEIDVEYDQAAIDDPNTPDEDREAWSEYQLEFAKATTERNNRIYARVCRKGVKIVKGLSRGKFIQELKDDGIEPPTDKKVLDRLYFDLEVFASAADFGAAMVGIALASGTDEDKIREAEEQFFRPVGKSDGEDAGSDPVDTETG